MDNLKYNIYIGKTSKNFSERGFEAILTIVLALGSLFLLFLFPVAGIALMFFAYGFICVGSKTYLLSIAKEQFLPIETIFSKYKIAIKAFCLKVATTLIQLLWTIIFIIPGIVCALNYSMSSFVMAKEDLPALECMSKSKKMVYGHRAEIFIVYLSYIFVCVAILCICAALASAINFYLNPPIWVALTVMGVVTLFLIVIFVLFAT